MADNLIPRCYNNEDVDTPIKVDLHNFSDAILKGQGQYSCLRLIDSHDYISCTLVMGKSHVAPSKIFDYNAEGIGLRGHHALLLDR